MMLRSFFRYCLRWRLLVVLVFSSALAGQPSSSRVNIPKQLVGDWYSLDGRGQILHIEADGSSVWFNKNNTVDLLYAYADGRYDSATHIFHFNGARLQWNGKILSLLGNSAFPERYKKCKALQFPQETYDMMEKTGSMPAVPPFRS